MIVGTLYIYLYVIVVSDFLCFWYVFMIETNGFMSIVEYQSITIKLTVPFDEDDEDDCCLETYFI